MTFLSGEIIGAIFFSMLADYIGRKRVYLSTLYVSTIVGSIVSIVQTYKQFVIIRFPIAALTQVNENGTFYFFY
jgi:MFS family permease